MSFSPLGFPRVPALVPNPWAFLPDSAQAEPLLTGWGPSILSASCSNNLSTDRLQKLQREDVIRLSPIPWNLAADIFLEVTVASRNLHFKNENLNPKAATLKMVSQSLDPLLHSQDLGQKPTPLPSVKMTACKMRVSKVSK